MPRAADTIEIDKELAAVRSLIRDRLEATAMQTLLQRGGMDVGGGKMLRGRLVLSVGPSAGVSSAHCIRAAAAVEMLQTASLLHDDVVDGGLERRGRPAFWVKEGPKMAVLLGDMLLSSSIGLVHRLQPDAVPLLVGTLQGMCEAEVDQEFLVPGDQGTWRDCLDIARRKTGALFGFAARLAAGDDSALASALQQAGTSLGTAYQLADDLLDGRTDGAASGKTLGTDRRDNKLTAFRFRDSGPCDPRGHIACLLRRAGEDLSSWPRVQTAWGQYIGQTMLPVIQRFSGCETVHGGCGFFDEADRRRGFD